MNGKKIGIMGGTFDPIHFGHLILAQTAMEQFSLDKIWFMPSKMPPHKSHEEVTSTKHRIEMTRLAIEDNPNFSLSLFEMDREGYTFTYETLQLLKKDYPNTKFYFIIGADSVYTFHKWREPRIVASLCTILAANRSQEVDEKLIKQLDIIREEYNADIHLLAIPSIEISSSDIRSKRQKGQAIQYFTHPKVVEYIDANKLYEWRLG